MGEWVDARRLTLHTTNAYVETEDGEEAPTLLKGGSGLRLSVRPGQTQLRLQGTDATDLTASAPVTTSDVAISECFAANGTIANEAIVPQVTFVAPVALSPTQVICIAPSRASPVVSDLDIALNGQDYHSSERHRSQIRTQQAPQHGAPPPCLAEA